MRAARKHLSELEKQLPPAGAQDDLFAPRESNAPAEDALRGELAALDPDKLSPREAMEALYRLKDLADE
ncbi:DNA mismatch repair protein MutS [compost metagenome]